MPQSYENVVTAIETLSSEQLSINFVNSRLLDEELKRNNLRTENTEGISLNITVKTAFKVFPIICFTCKKVGHQSYECRSNPNIRRNFKYRGKGFIPRYGLHSIYIKKKYRL